jgi:hypothetical protein
MAAVTPHLMLHTLLYATQKKKETSRFFPQMITLTPLILIYIRHLFPSCIDVLKFNNVFF